MVIFLSSSFLNRTVCTPEIALTTVDLPWATWPIVPILMVACLEMTSGESGVSVFMSWKDTRKFLVNIYRFLHITLKLERGLLRQPEMQKRRKSIRVERKYYLRGFCILNCYVLKFQYNSVRVGTKKWFNWCVKVVRYMPSWLTLDKCLYMHKTYQSRQILFL